MRNKNLRVKVAGRMVLAVLLVSSAAPPPARGQAQVATPDPVLEYRFDEGVGITAFNTGNYSNAHGTLFGAARFSTDVPPGVASSFSLVLDGARTTFVRVPDQFDYTTDGSRTSQRLGQLTIEAWIKPTELTRPRLVWDDYGSPGVILGLFDTVGQFSVSTDQHPGLGISNFSGKLTANTWHHLAGVYDGNQLRLFIDGEDTCVVVRTSGAVIDQSSAFPGAPAFIGFTAGDDHSFSGLIDELRIFPVALDRSELAEGFFASVPTIRCEVRGVQDLIAQVMALNLKQGISNSLDSKLEAAVQALDDMNENNNVAAVNVLQAFV
ncbi:MAG TPA: LamG domain-containing protein, partial [Candidatus Acidoferrales bacterium]